MEKENRKQEIREAFTALGLDPIDLLDYNKLYKEAKRLKEEAEYYAIAVDNIERHIKTITKDIAHNPFVPAVIIKDEEEDIDLRFFNTPEKSFSKPVDIHISVTIEEAEYFVLEYNRKVKNKDTGYKWATETKKVKLDLSEKKRYHLFKGAGDCNTAIGHEKDLLVTVNYKH